MKQKAGPLVRAGPCGLTALIPRLAWNSADPSSLALPLPCPCDPAPLSAPFLGIPHQTLEMEVILIRMTCHLPWPCRLPTSWHLALSAVHLTCFHPKFDRPLIETLCSEEAVLALPLYCPSPRIPPSIPFLERISCSVFCQMSNVLPSSYIILFTDYSLMINAEIRRLRPSTTLFSASPKRRAIF